MEIWKIEVKLHLVKDQLYRSMALNHFAVGELNRDSVLIHSYGSICAFDLAVPARVDVGAREYACAKSVKYFHFVIAKKKRIFGLECRVFRNAAIGIERIGNQ